MMNELDKIFRNKLNHYSADVPDSVWENIDQSLQNQKRSPVSNVWFIASTLMVVVVVSVLSLFWVDHISSNNINNQQHLELFKQNDTKTTDQSVATVSNTFIEQNVISENKDHDLMSKNDNEIFQADVVQFNNAPSHTDIATNKDIKSTISKKATNLPTTLLDDYLTEAATSIADVSKEKSIDNLESDIIESYRNMGQINVLPTMDGYQNLYSDKTQNIQITNFNTKPIEACPFNANYKGTSLDIYFSPDYIDKQLIDREGGEKLKDMRTTTESPMFSFSAGIRLGYNLGYRWNIHTGLNYSQINEKFEYTDPESSTIRIVIVKDYIYENGKVVDSIVKQEEILVPGTTSLTIYNKFRTIDIPVLGRYTIMANRHLSLSAVGGIYINISSFEQGTIISDATHKPVQLSRLGDEDSVVYKDQLGLSFYGSLSIAYHLTSDTDLLVEPYARIHPESITVSAYPLNQKFNRYGLNLGLRYKF